MSVPMTPARLTRAQVRRVRDLIARERLHDGTMPVDIIGLAERMGWTVRQRDHDAMGHVWMAAVRYLDTKVVDLNGALSSGAQRSQVAHLLGHEILGHKIIYDLTLPSALSDVYPDSLAESRDLAAWAVGAKLIIPQRFVAMGLNESDLAAVCHTTTRLAQRRIHGTIIEGEAALSDLPTEELHWPDLPRIGARARATARHLYLVERDGTGGWG